MKHLLYNRILPIFVFVPVVFALIGYTLSRFTSMTIVMWEIVFLVSIVLCMGIVWRGNFSYVSVGTDRNKQAIPWWYKLALIALPMLVMLPGLWAMLVDTGVQSITHSDFHASLINQIIHGTFPPVNPQIPDLPIGYYWLYHALMAVPTHLFSIAAPLVSITLISFSLLITLLYLWLIVETLGFDHRHYLVMSLLVMIILFNGNLFGVFHAWNFVVADGVEFISRRSMVLEGDPRLYGIWSKYINYNSVSLALMYFVVGIHAALAMLRGKITIEKITFISFGIIGGTVFLFVPGFFLGVTLVPALGVVYLIHRLQSLAQRSLSELASHILTDIQQVFRQYRIRTWLFMIFVLGFLYLSTFILGLHVLSLFPGASEFSLMSQYNLNSIVGVNYPLIPFLLVGLWLAIWKNDRLSQLMLIASVLGLTIAYIFVLSDGNQYKFVLQSSFYIGVIVCRVLYFWIYETDKQWLKRLGYASMLGMMVLIWVNISLIQVGFVRIALDDKQPFEYDGRYVMGTSSSYREMFIWLRENTPPKTLVIQPLEMEAFYTSLYSERLPYLGVYQFEFSKGIAEYEEREQALDLFYDPMSTLNQRIEAVKKFREYDGDRPMILAIPLELDIADDELQNLGLSFAHEVENASLYWFKRDGQFAPLVYLDNNQPLNTIFTFGDESISIQSIQVETEQVIEPCQSLWVSTWWRVTQPQDTDYLAKLVLVNSETNEVITHNDAVPGATLMTEWLPDTTYTDTRLLDIPCDLASGDYLLLVGMYEIDYDTLKFVADLPVFYQGAGVGNLGFMKTLTVE